MVIATIYKAVAAQLTAGPDADDSSGLHVSNLFFEFYESFTLSESFCWNYINVNESHKESNLNFCANNNKCQCIWIADGKIC